MTFALGRAEVYLYVCGVHSSDTVKTCAAKPAVKTCAATLPYSTPYILYYTLHAYRQTSARPMYLGRQKS
jgi:hypothetical protein